MQRLYVASRFDLLYARVRAYGDMDKTGRMGDLFLLVWVGGQSHPCPLSWVLFIYLLSQKML